MQTLQPFQETLPFLLQAEMVVQGSLITLTYQIQSSATGAANIENAIVGLPKKSSAFASNEVRRLDELWKTTCFEAFLKPTGHDRYYELNFSALPAWNAYEFQKYRSPQPPLTSHDFVLKNLQWEHADLLFTVQLENRSAFSEFNVSLTAVVELNDQSKHYLAVTHAEEKPDFHSAKSFTLLRGKK